MLIRPGAAIRRGAVLVSADGRIAAVGPDATVPTPPEAEAIDLGPGPVLMPGLINAHTHLELTGLEGRVTDDHFPVWIGQMRQAKSDRPAAEYATAARAGVRDGWRAGTTTVADTGDSGAVVEALTALGGRGVVYHEVFGPHPDQTPDAMRGLETAFDRLSAAAGVHVRVGVSPHAPYTVSAPLYERTAAFARAHGVPVAVHIAESTAESALVTRGAGAFADAWRERGIPAGPRARSPIAYLADRGVLETRPLAIHAVQTDAADARLLADHGCPVALCPRSNRRHGHGDPPVARLLDAGVRAGAGTDSVASVATLDLWAELRALRGLAGLSAAEALDLATGAAARVLDLDDETGTIEVGKWADLVVVAPPTVPDDLGRLDEVLVGLAADRVRHTYVAGRCVYSSPPS